MPTANPRRVLVVDDQASMRGRLRGFLEDIGIAVVEAENGIVALKRLEQEPLDLIITDIQMPGLDGLKLAQAVRLRGGKQSTPIILLTAQGGCESFADGVNSGAVSYLSKPIYPTELRRTLGRIFPEFRRRAM